MPFHADIGCIVLHLIKMRAMSEEFAVTYWCGHAIVHAR